MPHISSNDTTFVSFTEENIVILTHLPNVSPIVNRVPNLIEHLRIRLMAAYSDSAVECDNIF